MLGRFSLFRQSAGDKKQDDNKPPTLVDRTLLRKQTADKASFAQLLHERSSQPELLPSVKSFETLVPDAASFQTLPRSLESFATLPRSSSSFQTLVPDRASFHTLVDTDSFAPAERNQSFHTVQFDKASFDARQFQTIERLNTLEHDDAVALTKSEGAVQSPCNFDAGTIGNDVVVNVLPSPEIHDGDARVNCRLWCF